MTAKSLVVDRKGFCQNVEIKAKWNPGVRIGKIIKQEWLADKGIQQNLSTVRAWYKQYSLDKGCFDYDNCMAVKR